DAINFQKGMQVQFSASASGGTLLARDDSATHQSLTVSKVDFDAGTVTFTENVSALTGEGDGDYLFLRGNYSTNSADLGMVTGVAKWIPTTAETSGTFLQMDRTTHVQYLQGHRQSYVGSLEETVKKLIARMSRIGGRPDSAWVSFNTWLKLEMELQGRAYREDGKNNPFGLSSLVYGGPGGSIRFYADPFLEDGLGLLPEPAPLA